MARVTVPAALLKRPRYPSRPPPSSTPLPFKPFLLSWLPLTENAHIPHFPWSLGFV